MLLALRTFVCKVVIKNDTLPVEVCAPYFFSLLLLVQLRIDDACVVDCFELLFEDGFDVVDFLEGDWRFLEDAVGDLVGDDFLHQVVDALVRVLLHASGGRLHGVAHDEDGHLLRGW